MKKMKNTKKFWYFSRRLIGNLANRPKANAKPPLVAVKLLGVAEQLQPGAQRPEPEHARRQAEQVAHVPVHQQTVPGAVPVGEEEEEALEEEDHQDDEGHLRGPTVTPTSGAGAAGGAHQQVHEEDGVDGLGKVKTV